MEKLLEGLCGKRVQVYKKGSDDPFVGVVDRVHVFGVVELNNGVSRILINISSIDAVVY